VEQVLPLDGLRIQLVTTPRQTSAEWAVAVLDDHLTALAPLPGGVTAIDESNEDIFN
jgi:hypothetical protein